MLTLPHAVWQNSPVFYRNSPERWLNWIGQIRPIILDGKLIGTVSPPQKSFVINNSSLHTERFRLYYLKKANPGLWFSEAAADTSLVTLARSGWSMRTDAFRACAATLLDKIPLTYESGQLWYPIAQHAFPSGTDFYANRLIKREQASMQPAGVKN